MNANIPIALLFLALCCQADRNSVELTASAIQKVQHLGGAGCAAIAPGTPEHRDQCACQCQDDCLWFNTEMLDIWGDAEEKAFWNDQKCITGSEMEDAIKGHEAKYSEVAINDWVKVNRQKGEQECDCTPGGGGAAVPDEEEEQPLDVEEEAEEEEEEPAAPQEKTCDVRHGSYARDKQKNCICDADCIWGDRKNLENGGTKHDKKKSCFDKSIFDAQLDANKARWLKDNYQNLNRRKKYFDSDYSAPSYPGTPGEDCLKK